MDVRLDHRQALVTGSTGGLGTAIAAALAASGAFVVVSGRNIDRGRALVERIEREGGAAAFVLSDLAAGDAAVRELADRATEAAGGHLDILVNNAAMLLTPAPSGEVPAELIRAALEVNVVAPFVLTGALVPAMAERGTGAVVNIGSSSGLVGMARSALYGTTKAAIHAMTRNWAAEWAPAGVRVNTVAPGPTATDQNLAAAESLAPIVSRIPSGRMSALDEVAAAVVFLASDFASGIHGATLSVDGGFTAA